MRIAKGRPSLSPLEFSMKVSTELRFVATLLGRYLLNISAMN